jgi:hypothetical protein
MRKPPTIGEFTLSFAQSPSSRRGVYAVTRGGAPTLPVPGRERAAHPPIRKA